MKLENYYTLFSLIGLICDIIGAFFVSIEAIGIDKIINWKIKYFQIPSKLLIARKVEDLEGIDIEKHLKFPKAMVGLFVGFSVIIGISIGQYAWDNFSSNKGSIWGAFIGMILISPSIFIIPKLLANLLKKVITAINWTENNYRKGQAGIYGFAFLVIGFILQFIGSLIQFTLNLPK